MILVSYHDGPVLRLMGLGLRGRRFLSNDFSFEDPIARWAMHKQL